MKTLTKLIAAALVSLGLMIGSVASADEHRTTGRGTGPIIFVTSQGLYFDSIVLADLPPLGNFQQLIPTMDGLTTEFGPGQPGHLGGRWWIDINGDSEMDGGDKYFLCPLLGPGRETL